MGSIGSDAFKAKVRAVVTAKYDGAAFVDLTCAGICGGAKGVCASYCHAKERKDNWKNMKGCNLFLTGDTSCKIATGGGGNSGKDCLDSKKNWQCGTGGTCQPKATTKDKGVTTAHCSKCKSAKWWPCTTSGNCVCK